MGSSGKDGIPQLTGPNYENWRFRVKLFLDAAEVSSVLKEDVLAENAAERSKWDQVDRKAKSLLVGFISDECLGVVREKQTA